MEAVIPWVSNSDPIWVKNRKDRLQEFNLFESANTVNSFYSDRSMIDLCIASIAKNAQFIDKVTLVTQNQKPSNYSNWVAKHRHIKFRIIDHNQFIPAEFRPTYNIYCIQSLLHLIPDLEEHFFYIEDDMMFTKNFSKSEFIKNNKVTLIEPMPVPLPLFHKHPIENSKTKVNFLSRLELKLKFYALLYGPIYRHNSWSALLRNTTKLALKKTNKNYAIFSPHFPYIATKSSYITADKIFKNDLAKTRNLKIRSGKDLVSLNFLAHNISHFSGETCFNEPLVNCLYIEDTDQNLELSIRTHLKNSPGLLCLNDGAKTETVDQHQAFNSAYNQLLKHFS